MLEGLTSQDSNVLYANALDIFSLGSSYGALKIDPGNYRILLNTDNDYFGKISGGNTELSSNLKLELKANSGNIRLKSDSNTRIEKTDGTAGNWENGHLVLCGKHLWVDSSGNLRIKGSTPTSDTVMET